MEHTHQFYTSCNSQIGENRFVFQETPNPPPPPPEAKNKDKNDESDPSTAEETLNASDRQNKASSRAEKIQSKLDKVNERIAKLDTADPAKHSEWDIGTIREKQLEKRRRLEAKLEKQSPAETKKAPPSASSEADVEEKTGAIVGEAAGEAASLASNPTKTGTGPKPNAPSPRPENEGGEENDGDIDTPEEAEKGPEAPKTHADALFNELDSIGNKLEEAKTDAEKTKALLEAAATVMEIIKRFFNGTLFDNLEKKKGDESEHGGNDTAGNPPEAPAPTPAAGIARDLTQRQPSSAAEIGRALSGIQEDADKKIEANNDEIGSLKDYRETTEDQNKMLIDQRGEIEKQLLDVRGETGKEGEVFRLETELDRINGQIEANKKAINNVQSRIDDLTEENADLKKKSEAANKMKNNFGALMDRLGPALKQMLEAAGSKTGKIEFGFRDGNPIIIFGGDMNINIGTTNSATGNREVGADEVDEAAVEGTDNEQSSENTENEKTAAMKNIENTIKKSLADHAKNENEKVVVRNSIFIESDKEGKYIVTMDTGALNNHLSEAARATLTNIYESFHDNNRQTGRSVTAPMTLNELRRFSGKLVKRFRT